MTVDPTGKFAYVGANGSDDVYGYTISATSGSLTPIAGSPFADPGSGPEGVIIPPTGGFAYVPNSSSNNVAAYTISASSGALTPVAGSPFADPGSAPQTGAVDTKSKFAYVTNAGSSNITAYTIDAGSGALTPVTGSPFGAGSIPVGMATCRLKASKCTPPQFRYLDRLAGLRIRKIDAEASARQAGGVSVDFNIF